MALTEKDKADFAIAVGALCESFCREGTEGMLHGYWLGLCDLELGEVQIAIASAIRSSERFPTPHELRKLVGRSVSLQDNAVKAWSIALGTVSLGPYKHVDFEDKAINATIRTFGGWPQFVEGFANAESEKWMRIEFMKMYSSLSSSCVDGEITRPLPGLSEKQVVDGKLVDPIPKRIGCSTVRRIDMTSRPIAIEVMQ